MFYGFSEVADWRAFQHVDQIREILENRLDRYSAKWNIRMRMDGCVAFHSQRTLWLDRQK